jgi:hypothetical protein
MLHKGCASLAAKMNPALLLVRLRCCLKLDNLNATKPPERLVASLEALRSHLSPVVKPLFAPMTGQAGVSSADSTDVHLTGRSFC